MVLLFLTSFPFANPFPLQAFAAVNKYPNPLASHVVSMDVVSREIMEDGTVRSERLIGIQQDAPKWVTRMLGTADTTFVREVSFLVPSGTPPPPTFKPNTKQNLPHVDDWQQPPKLVLASTNLTLANFMQCRESITYIPHPWPAAPPPVLPPKAADFPSLDPDDVDHAEPRTGTPPLPPQTLFTQSALIFSAGSVAAERYPPHGINEDSPVAAHTYPAASNFVQRGAGAKIEQWGKDRFEMNAEKGRDAMRWAGNKWAKVWRAEEDKQRALLEKATVTGGEGQVGEERI